MAGTHQESSGPRSARDVARPPSTTPLSRSSWRLNDAIGKPVTDHRPGRSVWHCKDRAPRFDMMGPVTACRRRYSFDSAGILLYLWGRITHKDLLEPFTPFWSAPHPNGVPAWLDLKTNAVAPYAWSTGVASVGQIAEWAGARAGGTPAELPLPGSKDGYYSWRLVSPRTHRRHRDLTLPRIGTPITLQHGTWKAYVRLSLVRAPSLVPDTARPSRFRSRTAKWYGRWKTGLTRRY